MRCFLDPRRLGAEVCCPRRVSLCRMQLPEARLGPSVRQGLGAERPSWLRGHGWGLGAEGLRATNPASPRRRTRGEWVSGTGDPQQSSRAQGAGAVQPRFALWREGAGAKKACVAFSIRGAWGLWFAAGGEFPFAECSCQKIVWGRRCDGASALRGRNGSGGMAGACRRRLRAPNPASPRRRTRGEWVSDTGDPQQSSRAQGAWADQPRFALWKGGGRGRKRLALLSRSEARWGCGLLPEESFPLLNAAARRLFGAIGATGPQR